MRAPMPSISHAIQHHPCQCIVPRTFDAVSIGACCAYRFSRVLDERQPMSQTVPDDARRRPCCCNLRLVTDLRLRSVAPATPGTRRHQRSECSAAGELGRLLAECLRCAAPPPLSLSTICSDRHPPASAGPPAPTHLRGGVSPGLSSHRQRQRLRGGGHRELGGPAEGGAASGRPSAHPAAPAPSLVEVGAAHAGPAVCAPALRAPEEPQRVRTRPCLTLLQ